MELQQAIQILKKHNEWRRGSDIEMIEPSKIGIAIDVIVYEFTYNAERIKVERNSKFEASELKEMINTLKEIHNIIKEKNI